MKHDQNGSIDKPLIPANVSLPEITVRAVILGFILTIILAAANAYLGLKVGMTVSASIPAAVISMAILRFFRDSNVLENTMVQIMASVGEALTAGVAFILPALIMLKIWYRFDYWQTVMTALLGGSLGVLFTIPLRRALLQDKTLRYPEAVAIANVLKASASQDKGELRSLVAGGIVGATIAFCQTGFQIISDQFQLWFKTKSFVYGFGLGFSPALIAAGYIVGINVAISILMGVLLGWIIGVPVLTSIYGLPQADSPSLMAIQVWSHHIRYIGVGTMLIGGLWTLCTLFKPLATSMQTSFTSLRKIRLGQEKKQLRTERDIPINYVFWGALFLLIPIFMLICYAVIPDALGITNTFRYFISGFSTLYILIGGFLFCAIMAYFAGLIGSSNSPVSGLLVSALLVICLCLIVFFTTQTGLGSAEAKERIGIIVAIGSMVIVGVALAISNDTMQDLKVGQLMGATPWKQQTMLLLGVVVSSFVVPPILQLLFNAYGIGGIFPRPNMDPAQMLSAPQAGLMASVAQGVFSSQLEWGLIAAGAVIAVICVIVDEFLQKNYQTRLPVLAVGMGIYLPVDASMPVVIGGFLAYIIERRLNRYYRRRPKQDPAQLDQHHQRGMLLACGLVAGASIMGVILAIPFAIKESSDALKIMPARYESFASVLSVIVTYMLCAWMYRVVVKEKK